MTYNPPVIQPSSQSTMRLWRVSYLHSGRRIERPDELLSLQERHLMMKAAVLGPVQCWLHFAHWDRQQKRVQTLRIHILKPSAKSSCLYGQARTKLLQISPTHCAAEIFLPWSKTGTLWWRSTRKPSALCKKFTLVELMNWCVLALRHLSYVGKEFSTYLGQCRSKRSRRM
jgi:hypothetical protein